MLHQIVRGQEKPGPFIHENWRDFLAEKPMPWAYEYPFYTDAWITGEVTEGLGPYQLLNGLAFSKDERINPRIVLRANFPAYAVDGTDARTWTTDYDRYHGGTLSDEAAALTSLCLGIRLKAGAPNREFKPDGDPKGRPWALGTSPVPTLLKRESKDIHILPYKQEQFCLNDINLLQSLPNLSSADATALVLAARSYQNALWLAEGEPELSWLLFVSSIERAALHWSNSDDPPLQKIQSSNQPLFDLLLSKGEEYAAQVAAIIAPSLGVSSKFQKFLLEFMPDKLEHRPEKYAQVDWNTPALKKAFRLIYHYRSKALHECIPFPMPMCEPPKRFRDSGAYSEIPFGNATRANGGTWLLKDTPMLLHIFEYIVRLALLKWWETLATPNKLT